MRQDGSHVNEIADRLAICEVVYRWCQGVDRRDYDAVRKAYHPNAIDSRSAYEGNVEGLIAWLQKRHTSIPFCMHFIGNIVVDFADPHLALVESYVQVTQHYPEIAKASIAPLLGSLKDAEGGVDFVANARYVDRFERIEGNWRIMHRVAVNGRVMIRSANMPMGAQDPLGDRRDADDVLFKERRVLGLPAPVAEAA